MWKLQSALQNLRSKESIIIFSVASETPAIIWAIILNKYSHLWQGFKRNVHVCARVGSLRNNIYVLCKKYSSYCSNHQEDVRNKTEAQLLSLPLNARWKPLQIGWNPGWLNIANDLNSRTLLSKQYCCLREKMMPIIYSNTLVLKVLFLTNYEDWRQKFLKLSRLFTDIDELFLPRNSQISAFHC